MALVIPIFSSLFPSMRKKFFFAYCFRGFTLPTPLSGPTTKKNLIFCVSSPSVKNNKYYKILLMSSVLTLQANTLCESWKPDGKNHILNNVFVFMCVVFVMAIFAITVLKSFLL